MCGRYYINDDTAREIEKLAQQIDDRLKRALTDIRLYARDIHPSEAAPVITASGDGKLYCRWQRWGLFGMKDRRLIFNARCETVLEKRLFRESVEQRRIVVPAAWFYEWNQNREKNIFYRKEQPALFMAGFYDTLQGEERFVILTTAANASMKPVHDRMPLLLDRNELQEWLHENRLTEHFLRKTPSLLERKNDYEQLSLFPMDNSK